MAFHVQLVRDRLGGRESLSAAQGLLCPLSSAEAGNLPAPGRRTRRARATARPARFRHAASAASTSAGLSSGLARPTAGELQLPESGPVFRGNEETEALTGVSPRGRRAEGGRRSRRHRRGCSGRRSALQPCQPFGTGRGPGEPAAPPPRSNADQPPPRGGGPELPRAEADGPLTRSARPGPGLVPALAQPRSTPPAAGPGSSARRGGAWAAGSAPADVPRESAGRGAVNQSRAAPAPMARRVFCPGRKPAGLVAGLQGKLEPMAGRRRASFPSERNPSAAPSERLGRSLGGGLCLAPPCPAPARRRVPGRRPVSRAELPGGLPCGDGKKPGW
ncbi:skin secretory protein xP2-like [Candoia aspera]|uniref:skin secretory protein xP2-like n=1 Tax=Candoia aspera TaxID=51853 RepID=UPI002FD7F9FC